MKIFGAPVSVHWSVLLYVPIALSASKSVSAALLASMAWFVVMLAHEFGHAAVANRLGVRVLSVRLWALHGHCVFEHPPSPGMHVAIAWGGVGAQLLLVAATLFVSHALSSLGIRSTGLLEPVLYVLGPLNLITAFVNLIPIGNLDGAVAWGFSPFRKLHPSTPVQSIQELPGGLYSVPPAPISDTGPSIPVAHWHGFVAMVPAQPALPAAAPAVDLLANERDEIEEFNRTWRDDHGASVKHRRDAILGAGFAIFNIVGAFQVYFLIARTTWSLEPHTVLGRSCASIVDYQAARFGGGAVMRRYVPAYYTVELEGGERVIADPVKGLATTFRGTVSVKIESGAVTGHRHYTLEPGQGCPAPQAHA